MLTQLTITNFAIVRFLELELRPGMTTITGETGAGKSIAIDALSLALGERAEASVVRPDCAKAEISARFDIRAHTNAQLWLEENGLESESDECILRRSISKEGRSRAYINGSPVPVAQLKSIGQLLVNIHGQHAHQLLIKASHQLSLLDQYAGHDKLLLNTREAYKLWQALQLEKKQLLLRQSELEAKKQLLEYQVEELDNFALQEGEFERIEAEHARLANSSELQALCLETQACLSDNEQGNAQSLLQHSLKQVERIVQTDPSLQEAQSLLHEAIIQVDEVRHILSDYEQNLDMEPEVFTELEERLSAAIELSRKHQVEPKQLAAFHAQLQEELAGIMLNADRIEQIDVDLQQQEELYQKAAHKLSKSRHRYAKELNRLISESMQELNMPGAKFHIALNSEPEQAAMGGIDNIDFEVSANPGQPLQSLAKVASGGELSRISLAIEVIIATRVVTPTLIFDEVDVGVSGPTAAVVGKMMRSLGESTQVLCVTHLPQVAGTGHQQMRVSKKLGKKETHTHIEALSEQARLEELARLLGGDVITEATLANAKELIL